MAVEENLASINTDFVCNGSMQVLGRREEEGPLHCWRRWGHGPQTLQQAFANSCNMVCVELTLRLGPQTFYRYIDAFGLFDRTGLDNPVEARGYWWPESEFFNRQNHTQLAAAAFGQTFTVTPIQMITAVSAAINGGYLMQPYMVHQVTDSEGNIVVANEPTVVRQVLSNGTSEIMRTMLEDVVENGTGKNAQVRGYSVGGKTGTSEDIVSVATSEEGAQKDYIVSFVGFAPADDPEIVILLLLDSPSHSTGIFIGGGAMAAPVVGRMLEDILPLSLGIMPQYTQADLRDINIHVPRITGNTVEEASAELLSLGFEYIVIGDEEIVTGQLPAVNAFIASGSTIMIFAGEEVPREDVRVPNLSGMSAEIALRTLENRGLFIRNTGVPRSDSRAAVSVQSFAAGREIAYGSIVEVTLIDREIIERRN